MCVGHCVNTGGSVCVCVCVRSNVVCLACIGAVVCVCVEVSSSPALGVGHQAGSSPLRGKYG